MASGFHRIIQNYLEEEASKPCKTDKDGFSYICANKLIKGAMVAILTISILVLLFMPYYLEESLELALLLLVTAIFLLFFSLRSLLTRYTLTDTGLIYKTFTSRYIAYNELKEAARHNPPYIDKLMNKAVFFAAYDREIKIMLDYFYGSYSLIQQLEKEIGMQLRQKNTTEKSRNIRLILVLLIWLIIVFFLKAFYLN